MSAVAQYEFILFLLVAILALELLARRLRLPPAAAFILGGIALALLPGVPEFRIDPDLVLVVFLPPLLMSGAYFTIWREFRQNLSSILLLAVGATIFTTLAVGMVARWLVPELPWAVCFALGAIVSPLDAVAADAVLERLSLPGRITALLQGESLLNDATGLVLFRFAVAAALTGTFSATAALSSFCLVSLGGVAIGLLIGWIGLFAVRRLHDSDLAITATLLLAGSSYVGADRLQVSGVLATVTTGLMLGWHQHSDFTAGTRIRAQAFWKVLVFLLQSVLFILIGLSLRGVLARLQYRQDPLYSLLLPVVGIVLAVVLSRFVWLFGSDAVRRMARRFRHRPGPEPSVVVATIMSWAGMRGVVTLAAALSLPDNLPGRDLALACAFTVILVTVLLQGTTLAPLIHVLRLNGADELRVIQSSADLAWVQMAEAQLGAITAASHQPDGTERHPRLLEQYRFRLGASRNYAADRAVHRPQEVMHFEAILRAIEAGRAEILRMHRAGEIHDRVLREMEQELDLQQLAAECRIEDNG